MQQNLGLLAKLSNLFTIPVTISYTNLADVFGRLLLKVEIYWFAKITLLEEFVTLQSYGKFSSYAYARLTHLPAFLSKYTLTWQYLKYHLMVSFEVSKIIPFSDKTQRHQIFSVSFKGLFPFCCKVGKESFSFPFLTC